MLTGIPERALDGSEGEEGLGMSVAWALPVEFRAVRVPTRKEDGLASKGGVDEIVAECQWTPSLTD